MNGPNANATIQARQRLVPICRTLSQGGLQQGMHQEGALVLERLHTPETQYLARRSTVTDRTDQQADPAGVVRASPQCQPSRRGSALREGWGF